MTRRWLLMLVVLYIVHYPYECSEQRSSRILAIASLRDVLTAFHAKDLPTRAAMEHSIAVDVAWLSTIQGDDGGFAFWSKTDPSNPYLGLLASRKAGKWDSTQDNGFVLVALERYFHTYENATPDFIARVDRQGLRR